eukprot:CAMPEP_0170894430 /NCGR_PEP_ID=MMETSP0734-20130129/43170_1 /TAXON_ID=186038 /ORGANISM="Fragilariopsis kerguelensis, Strain L26-C5" /LENGTH=244 /DNA_ID=CAMNT_0011285431 /DNA_START=121 /DNA_END=855 /DNA_ORIENTATION=-
MTNTVVVTVDARRLGEGGRENNNIKHNMNVAPAPLLSQSSDDSDSDSDSNSNRIMIHSLDEKKEEVKKLRIGKHHYSNRKKKNKIENKKKEIRPKEKKKIYRYDIITKIVSKLIYEIESMIENTAANNAPVITTTTPLRRRRSLGGGGVEMMMNTNNAVSSSTSQSQSRLLPVSVSNNNNSNRHNNNRDHRSLYQAWARDNNNKILWWIWLIIALCAILYALLSCFIGWLCLVCWWNYMLGDQG